MKRSQWTQREERSNALLLRAMRWLSLRLGRRAGRMILHPVVLYFIVFTPLVRRSSRDFLRRALGRPVRWRDIYQHIYSFATTVHDRVYLMDERYDLFDIRLHGASLIDDALSHGRGAFLMGAHLGSFEVIRAIGRTQPDIRIVVTMYEENAQRINAALAAVNPAARPEVIALGQIDSMLKVNERLDANCLVGLLADRSVLKGDATATRRMDLFGAPATFSLGPFHMAAMLKRPVLFMTGLYRGGNRYDVHFETIADFTNITRGERAAAVDVALARYVELLERHCRIAPFNWFNFFDFWQADT